MTYGLEEGIVSTLLLLNFSRGWRFVASVESVTGPAILILSATLQPSGHGSYPYNAPVLATVAYHCLVAPIYSKSRVPGGLPTRALAN